MEGVQTLQMNAHHLLPQQVAYELRIRGKPELNLDELNEQLLTEQRENVDVVTAYPDLDITQAANCIVELDLARAFVSDRLVAATWFDSTFDSLVEKRSQLIHHYHRLQRIADTPMLASQLKGRVGKCINRARLVVTLSASIDPSVRDAARVNAEDDEAIESDDTRPRTPVREETVIEPNAPNAPNMNSTAHDGHSVIVDPPDMSRIPDAANHAQPQANGHDPVPPVNHYPNHLNQQSHYQQNRWEPHHNNNHHYDRDMSDSETRIPYNQTAPRRNNYRNAYQQYQNSYRPHSQPESVAPRPNMYNQQQNNIHVPNRASSSQRNVHFGTLPNRSNRARSTDTQGYNTTRFGSHIAPEYDRIGDKENSQEQQTMRRFMHNKAYDGQTIDKNYLSTIEFTNAIEDYRVSQQINDNIVLRNIALCLSGAASTWWRASKSHITNVHELLQGIRERFDPESQDEDSIITAIYSRRQGSHEFLLDYVDDILQLMERVPEHWSEQARIKRVVQGLNEKYSSHFAQQGDTPRFQKLKELRTYCTNLVRHVRRPLTVNEEKPSDKFKKPDSSKYVRKVNVIDEIDSDMPEPYAEPNMAEIYEMAKAINSASQTENKYKPHQLPLEPIPERLLNSKQVGDKPFRCFNCLLFGHNHYQCPYKLRAFCYGCGLNDRHVDSCPFCKEKPRKPNQPKN